MDNGQQMYNDPAGGTPSSIGNTQFNEFFYQKKALIEAAKETFFGQMGSSTNLPKNMGKTIKRYHYIPLLDDANVNDQGLDADGVDTTTEYVLEIVPKTQNDSATNSALGVVGDPGYLWLNEYAKGADLAGAQAAALIIINTMFGTSAVDYAAALVILNAQDGVVNTLGAVPVLGNLYGSSKDVGAVVAKLPMISETGGRVNRVGFRRTQLEGSIEKYGFYDEYTQESLDFDTDSELRMHTNREMIRGANEITEDLIQIDILNSAGVVRFGGDAATTAEVSGELASESVIDYEQLLRLAIDLDDNRCSKNTKMFSGTRMTDTKTIYAARYMYIGSELLPTLHRMKDLHDERAFIPVQQYASGGNVAVGEVGSVGMFRIIVVPEMMHWAAAGDDVTNNLGLNGPFRTSVDGSGDEKYNVYPMLVVGSGSFQTIGFQTSGKQVKFKIKHSKPGSPESYANDVFGETGFMSIKFYYGFLLLRPEHIAICKVVAEL